MEGATTQSLWPPRGIRSTRARVLVWFMVIVAVALGLNIVVVDRVMHARADAAIDTEMRHEVDKFRDFAARSVDPSTGDRFASAEDMLRVYLVEAVPEDDEALFSVVDGRAAHRARGPARVRLDRNSDVVATAAAATEPATHVVDTPAGVARYAVVPVNPGTSDTQAALVVVEFTHGVQAEVAQVVRITAVASGIALLVAAAISWFVAGRILSPLRRVRRTAEAIGASDLTRRIEVQPGARDDVARLAVTFNRMLDRLEGAFGTQRAFLDDAAHELRTPLTVIRGHLELMGDDPVERAEVTSLLLEEIGRMDRIVNDLFLLAAAQRPDFLRLAEVDLTDLVVGALARASALGPRQWVVAETAEAQVLADEQRLTQALVQLAANAVRFTRDGDPLRIGSSLRDGQVTLTVSDSGTGVPDDLRDHVFDRFTRGAGGGTGLGLAIVASIAEAHDGEAKVSDTPGGGATFTIAFPARFPDGVAASVRGSDASEPAVVARGMREGR